MQNTGFKNEHDLYTAINGKYLYQLNTNLKNLILKLSDCNENQIIKAIKKGGQCKPDIEIIINNISYNISIKRGSGNSVHQEPLNVFIEFLKDNTDINDKEINCIKLFIWSDGSYDNSGQISDRLDLNEMSKKYPDENNLLSKFFDRNKETLIKRFLKTGRFQNQPEADYLYYGNVNEGCLKKMNNVIEFLVSKIGSGKLNIGNLSFQAWNIVKNGNPKTENRRGVIQLKWSSIKKDLQYIEE